MGSHSYHTQVVRSSAMLLSCRICLPGVGALHPCKETERNTAWNLSNDHRLSEANKHQQSAHTRRKRPNRHHESGGKSYGTDTTNYGRKAPTQWTSRSCATLEIAEVHPARKSFIKCTEPINTTVKAARIKLWRERLEPLDVSVHLKPGVHTNDFAQIYGRRGPKLGHASLATVFCPIQRTIQPILRENLEATVVRYQPITTAVIPDACLNTRWHHGAYISPKEDTLWLPWESR